MRPACRECWDPVDRDGAELCDWCAMTPQERRRLVRRNNILLAIFVAAILCALLYGGRMA